MYSLTPGYRIPALQRGLSPVEAMLTKANVGVGSVALLSGMLTTAPPVWAVGAVGAAGALLNVAPGPRSIARWAAVGYRRVRERTAPDAMTTPPGTTRTWALYPQHGTMQDAYRRAQFHDAFSRALVFAGSQARSAGIQVHVTHHAEVCATTEHTQTISVHVPRGLAPARVVDTLEAELAALGDLTPLDPEPVLDVVGRGSGWIELEDGRYAATARITAWPAETDGDLMPKLLLGQTQDRSIAVLYRPLPLGQSRRSAKYQKAIGEAVLTDQIQAESHDLASGSTQGALVQGATLVDIDAYLTVWGDSPEAVTEARWEVGLTADRRRIRLDWLPGQQHRAHVMTTPHGASTRKGAIL
ncbi:hypothetical protein PV664_33915 [Streptomyces sp. ME01-18a]|uniref:hypothetical protein n=1 Tax=Streptomyces sp. ME01-18a TaxID=3028669 RepID=UPI0029B018AB|nr:hypothetical protein [Streptomyces sp. ME01-18a]MDX3433882.1 hypothetical protein [Streptomyces sp. ME01-18a]